MDLTFASGKFLALYFDDDQAVEEDLLVPYNHEVGWLPAKHLRPFSKCGPEGSPARGYDVTKSFWERARRGMSPLPSYTRFLVRRQTAVPSSLCAGTDGLGTRKR